MRVEWCTALANAYTKHAGVKAAVTQKGSGEALAQIAAEKANSRLDIRFDGTGDPHLQAAEQDLTLTYKSARLAELHPWAQRHAEQSAFKTVGIYAWGDVPNLAVVVATPKAQLSGISKRAPARLLMPLERRVSEQLYRSSSLAPASRPPRRIRR